MQRAEVEQPVAVQVQHIAAQLLPARQSGSHTAWACPHNRRGLCSKRYDRSGTNLGLGGGDHRACVDPCVGTAATYSARNMLRGILSRGRAIWQYLPKGRGTRAECQHRRRPFGIAPRRSSRTRAGKPDSKQITGRSIQSGVQPNERMHERVDQKSIKCRSGGRSTCSHPADAPVPDGAQHNRFHARETRLRRAVQSCTHRSKACGAH